jgi:hypothetical protein
VATPQRVFVECQTRRRAAGGVLVRQCSPACRTVYAPAGTRVSLGRVSPSARGPIRETCSRSPLDVARRHRAAGRHPVDVQQQQQQ